jgi:hypothetical protein
MRRHVGGWSKRRKLVALGIVAALIVGGGAAGAIIKINHDNKVEAEQREEQEHREQVADERRQERADEEALVLEELEAEEELEKIETQFGRESVNELEVAITDDAKGEAEEGISDYVTETSCEPEGGRLDISLAAQNFSCLAVTSEEGGFQEGYRYSGTINYVKGNLSWRLGGP